MKMKEEEEVKNKERGAHWTFTLPFQSHAHITSSLTKDTKLHT